MVTDQVEERLHEVAEIVKPRLRGVLHEAAFAVSLVTGTALVILAEGAMAVVACCVYAASVSLLFGTSAAYHRGSWSPRGRAVMERLDHSMIFVLIAGSYTPFCLVVLQGTARWVVFGITWGGALAGVITRNAFRKKPRWLFTFIYLALGWVAVGIMPALLEEGGVVVLVMLVAGGLLYTAGGIVYARKRPDPSPAWFGFHEVFHALTLAAFACHYVAISFAVYRAP